MIYGNKTSFKFGISLEKGRHNLVIKACLKLIIGLYYFHHRISTFK